MPQHNFTSVPNQWVDIYADPIDLSALVYLIRTRNYETDEATVTVRQLSEKYSIGHARAVRLLGVFRGYRNAIGTEPERQQNAEPAPGAVRRREPEQNRNDDGTEPEHGGSGGNVVVVQEVRTKKTTNARARVSIPSWLDQQRWQDFRDHRRKLKKPMTDTAEMRNINSLSRMRDAGYDPNAVIDEAIERGWQGFDLTYSWRCRPMGNAGAPLDAFTDRDRVR